MLPAESQALLLLFMSNASTMPLPEAMARQATEPDVLNVSC